MKIRFGVGLGADTDPDKLSGIVDRLESSVVDSLWFSELVYAKAVDPFVGMAYALAPDDEPQGGDIRGSVTWSPPRVGGQAAGRTVASCAATGIFPVPDGERAGVFDESLQLLRSVLENDQVAFSGRFFTITSAGVGTRPTKPLDIWLGGSAPAAFRRIGRFGDGWLGSFLTPDEARRVCGGQWSNEVAAAAKRRRPDVDPAELVATCWSALHRQIDGYVAAGRTKFVVRPAGGEPTDAFFDRFVAELLPRQN